MDWLEEFGYALKILFGISFLFLSIAVLVDIKLINTKIKQVKCFVLGLLISFVLFILAWYLLMPALLPVVLEQKDNTLVVIKFISGFCGINLIAIMLYNAFTFIYAGEFRGYKKLNQISGLMAMLCIFCYRIL